ncbi:MAG: OmpA family protein [Methyloligellaceae bacterium]
MTNSQNSGEDVSKLRELLFGQEKRVLSDIEQLVLKHEGRIGDDGALLHTVSNVLAGALREAEVNNHRELADAISPVVVLGIKREIRNSRDEMVDAFYPILGRLVSAYVSNAFKDFIEETNRRLEGSLTGRFVRLRLKSLFTRTPYQQLVLREARRLRIEELFLIKKGAGSLIDYWRSDPTSKGAQADQDEQLMSSLLTAVNEFANEAFSGGNEELRSMDVGASRIYLRASSSCLLVVKTSGYSGRRVEKLLDREMISVLEGYGGALEKVETHEVRRSIKAILPTLAEQINSVLAKHKRAPVLAYAFLTLIIASAISFAGWTYWDGHQTRLVKNKVDGVIQKYAELSGFPVDIKVAYDRSKVSLSGLSPDEQISYKMVKDIQDLIHPIVLETRFSHVRTVAALAAEQKKVTDGIGQISLRLKEIEKDLLTTATAGALKKTSEQLRELSTQLTSLKEVTASAKDVEKINGQVSGLLARLNHPRRKVRDWARSHAIFFGEEDDIRDPELVARLLKEFSGILMSSKARIRVIGYTDPTGTPHGNVALAVKRATKISKELMKYGVPASRLKVLGRPKGLLLSYDKGPNSSNRRVEFELIYEEETVEAIGEPLEIKTEPEAE